MGIDKEYKINPASDCGISYIVDASKIKKAVGGCQPDPTTSVKIHKIL